MVKVGWEGHTQSDASGMLTRLGSYTVYSANGKSWDPLGGFVLAGERDPRFLIQKHMRGPGIDHWLAFQHVPLCPGMIFNRFGIMS